MTIQKTMEGIAKIERTIVPPDGLVAIKSVTDEPPPELTVFPTFLNIEERAPIELRSAGLGMAQTRIHRWTIGCHLVFGTLMDPKYAYRERRKWIVPVLDKFQANPTLDGNVDTSDVVEVDFDPFIWPPTGARVNVEDVAYIAINLRLEFLDNE